MEFFKNKNRQNHEHGLHLDIEISQPSTGFTLLTSGRQRYRGLWEAYSKLFYFISGRYSADINSVYCTLIEATNKFKQSENL